MIIQTRKNLRLKEYDYSQNGAYFVTVCTQDKQKSLCEIVGGGVLDAPEVKLTVCGGIAEKYILSIGNVYCNVTVDKYIIMPNHVHLIIRFHNSSGPSRTPAPTARSLPDLISTFKRFSNKEYGHSIWQRNYYEHVIRNEEDYLSVWQYIENNPAKWTEDEYYITKG